VVLVVATAAATALLKSKGTGPVLVVSGFGSKKLASTSLPLCAVADDDRLPLVVAALVAIVAVVVVVVVAVVAVAVVLRLAVQYHA
jgi:hypothetical protein